MKFKVVEQFSQTLDEASVNRFKHHLEVGNPMAFISAYRKNKSKLVNEKNDRELKQFTKMMNFGFAQTAGGWSSDNLKGINEMSIAIIVDKDRQKELFDFAISMGERYEQDAVLLVPSDGDAFYISTNDEEDNWVGPKGTTMSLGRNISTDKEDMENIGGFSQVNRRKRNIRDFDTFVIGEDFTYDDDFSDNEKSMSNKICSRRLQNCVKQYGKDGLKKYFEKNRIKVFKNS